MRHITLVAAVLVLGAVGPAAQTPVRTPPAAATAPARVVEIRNGVSVRGKYVTLLVGTSVDDVAPGARASLLLEVTPGPKMHVYAPGQPGYIPIAMSVTADDAFRTQPVVFPPASPYTFAPLGETLKVYDERFRLSQTITLAATDDLKRRAASRDTLTIAGTLQYQACDDSVCYRPETLPVQWKLGLGR